MNSVADVDFLSGSANRVRVLELLSEAVYTRRELQETIGVSRSTVNRILDDFEARGWVEFDGRRYHASPPGALLSAAFGSLLATAEQVAKLVVVVRSLSPDVDFDPLHLANAEITVPNRSDVVAPARRSAEYMRRSRHVRLLVPFYTLDSLQANRDAVVEDGQSLEAVLTTGVLALIAADPEATACSW
jgi:predicted transcriptional regulator